MGIFLNYSVIKRNLKGKLDLLSTSSVWSACNVSQLQCNYNVIIGNSIANSYGNISKLQRNYT